MEKTYSINDLLVWQIQKSRDIIEALDNDKTVLKLINEDISLTAMLRIILYTQAEIYKQLNEQNNPLFRENKITLNLNNNENDN